MMKPIQKVVAAVLAVVIVVSMASCVPISLTKQWSYKYDKTDYDIGVYIYALYSAYLTADSLAKDVKGYKEGESFLDLKIKDDDEKKSVAREWIIKKAKESGRELVAVDKLVKENKVKWDKATMDAAVKTAQDAWDMGPYAMYGQNYYNPLSKQLEPYGVSFDSFKQLFVSQTGNTPYTVKTSALFDAYYAKGGSEEVSDKDLEEFFLKNYIDYSYIPVKLYDSSTDESGNAKNKAFSSKKSKKIQDALKDFTDDINKGATFDDIAAKCEAKYGVTAEEEVKNRVDALDSLKSSDEEVYKAVTGLKNGKAAFIVKDAKGDAPTAYIIVRNDINNDKKDYVSGSSRTSVLQNMKSDDFKKLLKDEAKNLSKDDKFSENEGYINQYSPDMFYEKPEETTTTAGDDSGSGDSES